MSGSGEYARRGAGERPRAEAFARREGEFERERSPEPRLGEGGSNFTGRDVPTTTPEMSSAPENANALLRRSRRTGRHAQKSSHARGRACPQSRRGWRAIEPSPCWRGGLGSRAHDGSCQRAFRARRRCRRAKRVCLISRHGTKSRCRRRTAAPPGRSASRWLLERGNGRWIESDVSCRCGRARGTWSRGFRGGLGGHLRF